MKRGMTCLYPVCLKEGDPARVNPSPRLHQAGLGKDNRTFFPGTATPASHGNKSA